jgi:hypothetical protein
MNNVNFEPADMTDKTDQDDMLPEYDFTTGVRGKHYKAYRRGHTVNIHQADGTTTVQHLTVEDGAVMLDPDVREYFPDAEAVNQALRTLISLFPKNRQSSTPQ